MQLTEQTPLLHRCHNYFADNPFSSNNFTIQMVYYFKLIGAQEIGSCRALARQGKINLFSTCIVSSAIATK